MAQKDVIPGKFNGGHIGCEQGRLLRVQTAQLNRAS